MSQTATQTLPTQPANLKLHAESAPRLDLKTYPRIELSPAIGLRFDASLRLSEILEKPQEEKEAFFKALAYEISLNGVAVFPKQSDLSAAGLEEVAALLQKYSGAPADSGFHIHPFQTGFDTTKAGGHVFTITAGKKESPLRAADILPLREVKVASSQWHSDATCERRPPAYSLFQVHTMPRTGGDTLFLSNYATFDKISPKLQQLLEGLTATHSGQNFHDMSQRTGIKLFEGPRGAPENVGTDFIAQHPVVRTNPLTNLKALFVNPTFTRHIDQLTHDESEALLTYLYKLQSQSHDTIVRQKWEKDDLAIWDNRSTSHTATLDYGNLVRVASRVTVVGEVPYLDKSAQTKKQYDAAHPQRLDLPEIQV